MVDYYKKAWKIAGNLKKYQYIRLLTIIWVLWVVYLIYSLVTRDYSDSGLGGMITNWIETIIMVPIICWITYVNARFFPWAKHVTRFEKSLIQDMEDTANQAYQETMAAGPRDKMVVHERPGSGGITIDDDRSSRDETPTNVPYSVRQDIKAKYGSNYDVGINTGSSAVNVPETSNVRKNYGSNYAVVAKNPADNEHTVRIDSPSYDISYEKESHKELVRRAKADKRFGAFEAFTLRTLFYPSIDFLVNIFVWPFSFLIGPIKMRPIIKNKQ